MLNRLWTWTMLVGAMLVFLPWLADPYMKPRLLLVLAGAIPLLLQKSVRVSSLEKAVLGFLLVYGFCWLQAKDRYYGFFGYYEWPTDSVLAMLAYLCVLFASARSRIGLDDLTGMVCRASIPMSMYAVFQRYFRDPLIYIGFPQDNRTFSSQGGPIFLGALLAVVIVMALHRLSKRQKDQVAWLALALAAWAAWTTGTRGAFLAAAVGGAFFFRWTPLLLLPAIPLLVRSASAHSDAARMAVWKTALRVFLDNPLTGYGPGNFMLAFRRYGGWEMADVLKNARMSQAHAHNEILHYLATTGALGAVAMACLLWAVLRFAWQHPERKLLLSLIATFFVFGTFNPVAYSAILVMVMVFGVASSQDQVWDFELDEEEDRVPYRRWFSAALASGLLWFTVKMCVANYYFGEGFFLSQKKDHFASAIAYNKAVAWHPYEMMYVCRQVDSLYNLVEQAADKKAPIVAGHMLAAKAIEDHRWDPYAHELVAKTTLVTMIWGLQKFDRQMVWGHLDNAYALAPTFDGILWRRFNFAKGSKDKERLAQTKKDLDRLKRSLSGV